MNRVFKLFALLIAFSNAEAKLSFERDITKTVEKINQQILANALIEEKNFILDFRKTLYKSSFLSLKDQKYLNDILKNYQKNTQENVYIIVAYPLLVGSTDNEEKVREEQKKYAQEVFKRSNLGDRSVLISFDFALRNIKGNITETMQSYPIFGSKVGLKERKQNHYCIIDQQIPDDFGNPSIVKYKALPPDFKSSKITIYGHTDNETHHILNILTNKYKAGQQNNFFLSVYKSLFETHYNHGNPKMKVHRKSLIMLFKKKYGGYFTGTTIRLPYPVNSYSKSHSGAKISLDNASFTKLIESNEPLEKYYFEASNSFGLHNWLSELSHSRQAIDGRLSKLKVIRHEIAGFFITFFTLRWFKKYDYTDAYGRKQNDFVRYAYVAKYSYEYEAHSIVQPQIMKEYTQRGKHYQKGKNYTPPPVNYKRNKK